MWACVNVVFVRRGILQYKSPGAGLTDGLAHVVSEVGVGVWFAGMSSGVKKAREGVSKGGEDMKGGRGDYTCIFAAVTLRRLG